ncbi:MAG TPA: hypothetical protein VFT72_19435 [Opitutaceae bacterium]|nr:hypothetical protein [Opitutaceae bacterium]
MKTTIVLAGVVVGALGMTGCSVIPTTTKRAVATGIGAAAGGAAGYSLGDKKPGWAFVGAGAGALATGMLMGEDGDVRQAGFDDGYVQGQADAIKRQYFLRQALEAEPLISEADAGKVVHYVVPGPTVTVDGRKLEPHSVTLSVTE